MALCRQQNRTDFTSRILSADCTGQGGKNQSTEKHYSPSPTVCLGSPL
jgi:hypothetical protein